MFYRQQITVHGKKTMFFKFNVDAKRQKIFPFLENKKNNF